MRITGRDVRLAKEVALSRLMSRDQIVRLGYFTSVSRANRRLTALLSARFLRQFETPFIGQRLFWVGPEAIHIVGEKIASVVQGRIGTPRFVRHSLMVTEVRLALLAIGGERWRYEVQLWTTFHQSGERFELRPDGLVWLNGVPTFLEVDLGHVSRRRFAAKLRSYTAFIRHPVCQATFQNQVPEVLVITTGSRHAESILGLAKSGPAVRVLTFADMDIQPIGCWS
ncbi:MAG: replication-relaxation family protein [Armatimonadetes bacterium]|nr:replication-relaxation family protein [Armatimonadota bacterium]